MQNMRSIGAGKSSDPLAQFLQFYAPLNGDINLSKGTGPPTFVRGSKAYYPNASGVITEYANDVPVVDTAKGVLVEPTILNVCKQSQDFATTWEVYLAAVTANQAIAPDGTQTADLLYPTSSALYPCVYQGIVLAAVPTTVSIYVKSAGFTWVAFRAMDGGGTTGAWFNIVTGELGQNTIASPSAVTPRVTSTGNGWFRISISGTGAGSVFSQLHLADADGSLMATVSGASGVYLWGGQVETSSVPTSYIPTTTGSVQRNACSLSYPVAGNLTNTAGTIYCEYYPLLTTGTPEIISSSSTNGIKTSSTSIVVSDGTNTPTGQTLVTNAVNKIAVSWGGNGIRFTRNGAAVTTGTFDGSMGFTDILVGSGVTGFIKSVKIYSVQVVDADLIRITA